MTQNSFKTLFKWTEKHIKFCLENRLARVSQYLWQWLEIQLHRYPSESREIVVGVDEFQEYITKEQGYPFTLSWVKSRIEQLEKLGIIKIVREFGRGNSTGYKLILKHIEALIPPKKRTKTNSPNSQQNFDLDTSNPTSVETDPSNSNTIRSSIDDNTVGELPNIQSEAQQNEELERRHEILSKCSEFGILFNPFIPSTEELFDYEHTDIEQALNHFVESGGHECHRNGKPKIHSPHGWLINCLRYSWHLDKNMGMSQFIDLLSNFLPKNVGRNYA
jgi:hypothetical protein